MRETGRRRRHPRRRLAELAAVVGLAAPVTFAFAVHTASGQPGQLPVPVLSPVATPSPAASPLRHVVTLGDSVSAGAACSCSPYGDLVARQIAADTGHAVSSANLSLGGETASQLTTVLRDPRTIRTLRDADVALVTIGANDLESLPSAHGCADLEPSCYAAAIRGLGGALQAAMTQLRHVVPPHATVVLTGYWNVFLDGAVARGNGPSYVVNSDTLTRRVNEVIQSVAQRYDALYLDTYSLFKADTGDDTYLLAADGDHPDAEGHRLIANGVLELLRGAGCRC